MVEPPLLMLAGGNKFPHLPLSVAVKKQIEISSRSLEFIASVALLESLRVRVRSQADRDTSLHIEGFYQSQLTDNIAIMPGVIWVTAPDSDDHNADTVIAWLRTTIKF